MQSEDIRKENVPSANCAQPAEPGKTAGQAAPRLLAAFALPEEVIPVELPGFEVIPVLTRISKPYAAATLAKAVADYQPVGIINIGTAGTQKHHIGDILVSTRFVDRDLRRQQFTSVSAEIRSTSPLPYALPSVVDSKRKDGDYVVNTGDDFVTAAEQVEGDVIDMEAFACAAVAEAFGLPFVAVKYVTDIVGQNSMAAWEARLADARSALTAYFAALG